MTNIPSFLLLLSGWLIALAGVFMIVLYTFLLTVASGRAGLSPRMRAVVPLLSGGGLAAWFALALVAARAIHLAPMAIRRPLALTLVFAPFLLAIACFSASRSFRLVNAATPSSWLIRAQLYRVVGFVFLPFLYFGALPAAFALPAAIGDMITGIASPFVASAIDGHKRGAFGWAVVWNLFGIVDLIAAPTAAILLRANLVNIEPLALVGFFVGPPLGILTHLLSLRNLTATRSATGSATGSELCATPS